ncbi:MAG: virulence factor SrfB [Candidatus Riflebacteria bacterium]|nr:virulence factor SrfB [Candidatus Riflebacteria bacterium]
MMEKIECLVNSGVSFYTPENDLQFPDALLFKTWTFRVLQSPKGAISLQLGATPIIDALAEGKDPLIDIGQLSLRFQDVLNICTGKWLPLPFSRKGAEESVSRSKDWVRLFLHKPPLKNDANIFRYVLAFDTLVNSTETSDNPGRDLLGFFPEDVGLPFELNPGSTGFWQTPTLLNWIKNIFKEIPAEGADPMPPHIGSLAAFMTLVDGLKQADIIPEITFLNPEGQNIDAHLILDLGNSRACGIIAEQAPGQGVNLDECCKLEIRDLSEPTQTYTEPFDTSFKFRPPLFFDPNQGAPHAGAGFFWPSLLRLGREAANLEPSDVGDTGMSSPKRYLWDNQQRHFPWYFNLPEANLGKKINAPFLKFLDENAVFRGDKAQPPFEPCYPPSSMMVFLILEVLNHCYSQINSFSFRKSRGHRLSKRVLRNIVITTPSGMSGPERDIYRERAQSAIDLYFHVFGWPEEMKPKIHLEFDEATAVQLTYLYGEVKHRFLGNAKEVFETLGRERAAEHDLRKPIFRLASIDIGGGTSDLMIAEYNSLPAEPSGARQKKLFSEGFSIAGDEIAKRIIEKIIIRRVFSWAQQKNQRISWEEFQLFFGPGRGGRDKHFIDMKAELCRQVWIPMAHRHLEFAELETDDTDLELGFDQFFLRRLPGANVLDFFAEHLKKEFDCDITLPEIPWQLSKRQINTVIANVIENILRIFSEVIAQFDCDALILGGKPSSLPIIREILVRLMPVSPEKIISLKGYPVGSWYPFSQKGGGISDPKTTCVMGAAVWLFSEKLRNLDGLNLITDPDSIQERKCFIGTFSPEDLKIDQMVFPSANGVVETNKSALLGIRRVDSEVCPVNPIWELLLDRENLKGQGPFKVKLVQDPKQRECLSIEGLEDERGTKVDSRLAKLRLRTMIADQYWLDTGSFDL